MQQEPASQNPKEPRRRKIALACEPCRERKSRCDGHKPICAACTRRRLPIDRCIYVVENARLASNNEYVRALLHRIRELEAGSGSEHAGSESVNPPARVNEEAPAAAAEVCPSQSNNFELFRLGGDYEHTLLPNQESQTLGPSDGQKDILRTTDSPGNVTGMGAMTNINENDTVPCQNSEYFGGSSAASLVCLLTSNQKQQRRHAWASQKSPPLDWVSNNQFGASGMASIAEMEAFALPPRDLADHLLGCFWERVYCLYPFFDRQSFQQAYENL